MPTRSGASCRSPSSKSSRGSEPDKDFLNDLRFHDLRHEATTRLFERGLGLMEVAAITGHKTESVYRRYAILSETDFR